jgi:hypothetical protein
LLSPHNVPSLKERSELSYPDVHGWYEGLFTLTCSVFANLQGFSAKKGFAKNDPACTWERLVIKGPYLSVAAAISKNKPV